MDNRNVFSTFDLRGHRDEGHRRRRSHQNRDVPRVDSRWDQRLKKNLASRREYVGIPGLELGRAKIMWPTDIFPIRLELMYRQYCGDASKAA